MNEILFSQAKSTIMKRSILFICLLLSVLSLSSCGVMFGGSKYIGNIKVIDHPNAEIYANGVKIGQGEVSKEFPRNKSLNIEVKQEGCEPKKEIFPNQFRTGNFILSVVSWGFLGAGIDLGTGAAFKPEHKNNKSVQRESDKKFSFNIDYSDCL